MTIPTVVGRPGDARASVRLRVVSILAKYGIAVLIPVVVIIAIGIDPAFLSAGNVRSILRGASNIGIVAIGMTLIVYAGNYADLSAPAQVTLAAMTVLALSDGSLLIAVPAAVFVAMAVGLLNGVLVGAMGGNPIIITLGVQLVLAGAIVVTTSGGAYVYGASEVLNTFGRGRVGFMPTNAIVLLLLVVVAHLVLSNTAAGRRLAAVGESREVAHLNGIPVVKTVLLTFVAASMFFGLAGVLIGAQAGQVGPGIAVGIEFDALAAVVIGGTSLAGGHGSVLRTLGGVIFIGLINNVMLLAGLKFEGQLLVKGAVILLAVAGDMYVQRSHATRRA